MHNKDVEYSLSSVNSDLAAATNVVTSLGLTSNLTPYINKYSIIKACGAIEVSYKAILTDYLVRRAKSQIKNYIHKSIRDSSSNPSYDNICKTLKSFDENWSVKFKRDIKAVTNHTQMIDSLDSLVDARNSFSHGGDPTTTVQEIQRYFCDSIRIIEVLDNIIK